MRRSDLVFLVIFAAALTAACWGVFQARRAALAAYGTSAAQQNWDNWREKARQDTRENAQQPGQVARRAPRSSAPPALVLMRDYFGICLTFALIMTSALMLTILGIARGVLRHSDPRPES